MENKCNYFTNTKSHHSTIQPILLYTINLLHNTNYIPINKHYTNKMTIQEYETQDPPKTTSCNINRTP